MFYFSCCHVSALFLTGVSQVAHTPLNCRWRNTSYGNGIDFFYRCEWYRREGEKEHCKYSTKLIWSIRIIMHNNWAWHCIRYFRRSEYINSADLMMCDHFQWPFVSSKFGSAPSRWVGVWKRLQRPESLAIATMQIKWDANASTRSIRQYEPGHEQCIIWISDVVS